MSLFSLAYYRFLEEVGGKGAANQIGCGFPDDLELGKEFKVIFKEWNEYWKMTGQKPLRRKKQ